MPKAERAEAGMVTRASTGAMASTSAADDPTPMEEALPAKPKFAPLSATTVSGHTLEFRRVRVLAGCRAHFTPMVALRTAAQASWSAHWPLLLLASARKLIRRVCTLRCSTDLRMHGVRLQCRASTPAAQMSHAAADLPMT